MDFKLFHGDCLDVIKENIQDNSIDLIVTDPPYLIKGNGFNAPAGKFKDRNIFNSNEGVSKIKSGFDLNVLHEFNRIMKKWNCYIYCNKDLLFELITFFKQHYPQLYLDVLVERIKNPIPFCNTYLNNLDYILFIRENGVKINGSYHDKTKYREKTTNKKDLKLYKHPTCKYVDFISEYIANSSQEGDTVLDAYLGSGTTGVACKNLSRNFIGIEIEKKIL